MCNHDLKQNNFILTGAVELPCYIIACIGMDKLGRRNTLIPFLILSALICVLIMFIPQVSHISLKVFLQQTFILSILKSVDAAALSKSYAFKMQLPIKDRFLYFQYRLHSTVAVSDVLLESDVKCSQGFREPGLVKCCVDTLLALKRK